MKRPLNMAVVVIGLSTLLSCGNDAEVKRLQAQVSELKKELEGFRKEKETVRKNLALYDELDLEAFNNRDMKRIGEIHAPDVKVYNTNNTLTEGMFPTHEAELNFLFKTFSDFDIYEHTIGFGEEDWTAGIAKCRGTFDTPMTLPNGAVIQPTGKKFEVRVATIAKWKDGRIVEEWLFWDNEDWMRQIGVTP
ncbi:ester cyclase [Fulvivirgaceae bacterium BMA10]|uniref:Ester cyclase n=1 Tax=Splendidivirga corallicola TaxID=3051826 RepID=A0ABT8KJ02_9BACT|nr:ester cyclase [Fulvivirgaceae bacterium BMA10]